MNQNKRTTLPKIKPGFSGFPKVLGFPIVPVFETRFTQKIIKYEILRLFKLMPISVQVQYSQVLISITKIVFKTKQVSNIQVK